MKKIQILTVIYNETEEHYNMALNTWKSFPSCCEITAVINKKLEGKEYPKHIKYIENDENCLSKAWNIGLKKLFKKHDYVFVSGLDSISPKEPELKRMIEILKKSPESGIVSAVPAGVEQLPYHQFIIHGDGSFSFFLISKDTFEKVGDFDERYKPAYFEDNDYLERLWKAGYFPRRDTKTQYMHIFQGTAKYGTKIKKEYPVFMQKNLELFKSVYNKVPDHLPQNIRFN